MSQNSATRAQLHAMRNLAIPYDSEHPPTFTEAAKLLAANATTGAPIVGVALAGGIVDPGASASPESPTVEWATFETYAGPGRVRLNTPHVAALPDGILVNLPAGTTLRAGEDADAIGVSELHETASGAAQIQLGPVTPAQEPELTPAVVLHAMLRAYEADLLDLEVSRIRRIQSGSFAGWSAKTLSGRHANVADLRTAAAYVLGGYPWNGAEYFSASRLGSDYAARLAGTTALDAPPAGVTSGA